MLPSIFGENLFDDFFGDDFGMFPMWNGRNPLYGKHRDFLVRVRKQPHFYKWTD